MSSSPSTCGRQSRIRTWAAGAAAFALPLLLYLATLAPSVTFEDSGELITVAAHLGVAHPSGYPLWCLLAHAFTWLPLGDVAWRVNLSSAVFGAGAVWLAYLCAVRVVRRRDAALLAALALAVSRVFWSQSLVAEVYTLNALATAWALYCVLAWRDDRRSRWLYGLAAGVGLGASNHSLFVLVTPVFLVWLLALDWRALLRPRVVAGGTLLVALGLSLHVYLPLRASAVPPPPINWGAPTTLSATFDHVTRRVYQTGDETIRQSGELRDWGLHSADALAGIGRNFTWPVLAVALLGVPTLARTRRDTLWASLAIVGLTTVVVNGLLDEAYSFAWRYIHRVYYLQAHLVLVPWLAAGLAVVFRALEARSAALRPVGPLAAAAGVAGVALWHGPAVDRSDDWLARDLGRAFLESLPERAGVLPVSEEILFPVLYLQHVEGLRTDVKVLSPSYGWDGSRPSKVVSPEPLNAKLRRRIEGVDAYDTIPHGLGYLLVPRGVPYGHAGFVPVPEPLAPQRPFDPDDLFEIAVYRRLSGYHARVGSRLWLLGRRDDAQREFELAERYASDGYAHYLLATLYADLGLEPERRGALLQRALELFDRYYEPAIHRHYPVTRADIESAVTRERLAASAAEKAEGARAGRGVSR